MYRFIQVNIVLDCVEMY